MEQVKIPCVLMRGGTSKGPYFLASDLPSDPDLRDKVLLAVMGSPDLRQVDGLGGADPLTSKVAIVSPSSRPGVDVDYLFAQVVVNEARVDTVPNCGNMLAGVGPFAIEKGLVAAEDGETVVSIYMENSSNRCDAVIQTPGGTVTYEGDARIDGTSGTSAPVMCNYLDIAGSACGELLPTGNIVDVIDGVPLTCIDNGMPVVVFKAEDVDRTGYESREELNADTELKERIEAIRLQLGERMNLGDVTEKVVPKMSLVAPPRDGGAICTRTFIPHVCHAAIGVLGAVSVATAAVLPGSPANEVADLPPGPDRTLSVEHPSGEFSVGLQTDESGDLPVVTRAALLRTTRKLFQGKVLIPGDVWDGREGLLKEAAE